MRRLVVPLLKAPQFFKAFSEAARLLVEGGGIGAMWQAVKPDFQNDSLIARFLHIPPPLS